MQMMRRQLSRQSETLLVFFIALCAVLLYTVWGSTVLAHSAQANAQQSSSLTVNE